MHPPFQRSLSYVYSYYDAFALFNNITDAFWNASQQHQFDLAKTEDVNVDTVLTSLVLNTVVFVLLMAFYECMRRILPAVYSSQKRLDRIHLDAGTATSEQHDDIYPPSLEALPSDLRHSILTPLPEARPLDWVLPVFGVPWKKVRRIAGESSRQESLTPSLVLS